MTCSKTRHQTCLAARQDIRLVSPVSTNISRCAYIKWSISCLHQVLHASSDPSCFTRSRRPAHARESLMLGVSCANNFFTQTMSSHKPSVDRRIKAPVGCRVAVAKSGAAAAKSTDVVQLGSYLLLSRAPLQCHLLPRCQLHPCSVGVA